MTNGLRYGGGTQITLCCGKEAIPPADGRNDYQFTIETDEGREITDDNFPEADLVCPGCGRT
jgi:hypothetical protein